MKKPLIKKRTVKAWAILMSRNQIASIVLDRRKPTKCVIGELGFNVYKEDIVVPITITYQLPKTKTKRK